MTADQLALDCEPTWHDPEPDDEDDDGGPYCAFPLDIAGHITPRQYRDMTTITPAKEYL